MKKKKKKKEEEKGRPVKNIAYSSSIFLHQSGEQNTHYLPSLQDVMLIKSYFT